MGHSNEEERRRVVLEAIECMKKTGAPYVIGRGVYDDGSPRAYLVTPDGFMSESSLENIAHEARHLDGLPCYVCEERQKLKKERNHTDMTERAREMWFAIAALSVLPLLFYPFAGPTALNLYFVSGFFMLVCAHQLMAIYRSE